MLTQIMVIDNFLDNAEELRQLALRCEYPEPENTVYYPGRNSTEQIPIEGLTEMVSKKVGERLSPTDPSHHAKFRIALEGDIGEGGVHIDHSHWSGILYLSRNEDCKGGTDLYRHIPTDTDFAPTAKPDLEKLGFEKAEDVWTKILWPDTHDTTKWEPMIHIPMRFNRLLLLRPWFYHNAGPGFGNSLENGRLVYLMFFDSLGVI